MREQAKQNLTLDQPVPYQIKVPGELDVNWLEWAGEITVMAKKDDAGLSVTILTGTFDQAALQGLMRRLYSMGLPLISVICVNFEYSSPAIHKTNSDSE